MESIVSPGLMRCVLYWDEDSDDGRWAHYWYSARELNSKFQPDNNSLRIKFHHQPLEENKLSLDWVGGTSSSAQQAACQRGVIILMGVYIDFYTRQRWWSNNKQSRHHDCVWLCDGCSARFGFAHVCCTDGKAANVLENYKCSIQCVHIHPAKWIKSSICSSVSSSVIGWFENFVKFLT